MKGLTLSEAADRIRLFHGQPTSVISECLRGFLIPNTGAQLIAADFSNIESRVLAWLAGEKRKIEAFETHGKVYEMNAADALGIAIDRVTSDQRQMGKVIELSMGFGGGVGAFATMGKAFQISLPDTQVQSLKNGFRAANPNIVQYWRDLNHAATAATLHPGKIYYAGGKGAAVAFKKSGSFLCCKLPSNRVMVYPYPRVIEQVWAEFLDLESEKIYSKSFHGLSHAAALKAAQAYAAEHFHILQEVSSSSAALSYFGEKNGKWVRIPTYGGKLSENVTQAVSRDFLAVGMERLEQRGYWIVLHVHDEAMMERTRLNQSVKEVEDILCEPIDWGRGCPIAAEGWEGFRYRK